MKQSAKTGSGRTFATRAPLVVMLLALTACSGRDLAPAWQDYVERYYRDGRIVDTDNDGVSHSEGQGYGMLLAVHYGDRHRFDALWRWTRETLSRGDGLLSWRYRPCPAADASCVDDPNNASDGDVLIAWALLRAAERFDDDAYARAARRIGAAIRDHLLVDAHGYRVLLPGRDGFVHRAPPDAVHYRLNLSYWVFPALEHFDRRWDDDGIWRGLAEDGYRLLRVARFGERELHPDWFLLTAQGPRLAVDDTRYGYNACRIPLHLAWSRRGSRDDRALGDILRPYADFWRGKEPPPAWVDLASGAVADYPWSPGMAAIADAALALAPASSPDAAGAKVQTPAPARDQRAAPRGYFSDSLRLLAAMATIERRS